MTYKCVCKTYVIEPLQLCPQCAVLYGSDWKTWPVWVSLRYHDINFGHDDEYSLDGVKAEPLGKKGSELKDVQDPQLGERGRRKCPACGKPIKVSERLCKDHLTQYGRDQDKWPLWLQALVSDDQRIIDAARNHRENSIDDETFTGRQAPKHAGKAGGKIPGSFGGRTIARNNQDEISTEAVYWSDDEIDAVGSDNITDAPITGDRNGYKYNAAAWRGESDQYKGIEGYSERDQLEDKIAAEQELEQWNPTAAAVLLLFEAGHNQTDIAKFMKIRQQKVSEILRKAVKRD